MRQTSFKFALLISLLTGCASQPSLYEQLGSQQGVDAIVGRFIYNLESEPRVSRYFEATNLNRFYEKFGEHMCEMTNGPCVYTGDSILQVHSGMNISEQDFNLLVELLMDAMDQEDVSQMTQNQLIKLFVPMRPDVIYQ
jgi:hemoglobin